MQLLRLATADLRRDWALSLCQVFALAAVLTPLLVVAGLQQGVLGPLLDGLRRAPAMREIGPRVTGANRFTEAWIEETRRRPDVSFIEADARFNAAELEATPAAAPDGEPVLLTLMPSSDRDPLREGAGPWVGPSVVALSARAARDLGVGAGGALLLRVPRTRNGADESRLVPVAVAQVLPGDRLVGRRVVLAPTAFVLDVQQFRDGYAVPARAWPGLAPPAGPPHYERFRLYAKTIDDVAPLVRWLEGQGIDPVSRLSDIGPVLSLDHGLSVILLVVAGFALAGMVVAIAATQWNGVQRKRRELALLGLIGYGRCFLVCVALAQGLLLGIAGAAVSFGLFAAAAGTVDGLFAQVQRGAGGACRLAPWQAATAAAVTLALTVGASALAGWQIARIAPAEVLRDT